MVVIVSYNKIYNQKKPSELPIKNKKTDIKNKNVKEYKIDKNIAKLSDDFTFEQPKKNEVKILQTKEQKILNFKPTPKKEVEPIKVDKKEVEPVKQQEEVDETIFNKEVEPIRKDKPKTILSTENDSDKNINDVTRKESKSDKELLNALISVDDCISKLQDSSVEDNDIIQSELSDLNIQVKLFLSLMQKQTKDQEDFSKSYQIGLREDREFKKYQKDKDKGTLLGSLIGGLSDGLGSLTGLLSGGITGLVGTVVGLLGTPVIMAAAGAIAYDVAKFAIDKMKNSLKEINDEMFENIDKIRNELKTGTGLGIANEVAIDRTKDNPFEWAMDFFKSESEKVSGELAAKKYDELLSNNEKLVKNILDREKDKQISPDDKKKGNIEDFRTINLNKKSMIDQLQFLDEDILENIVKNNKQLAQKIYKQTDKDVESILKEKKEEEESKGISEIIPKMLINQNLHLKNYQDENGKSLEDILKTAAESGLSKDELQSLLNENTTTKTEKTDLGLGLGDWTWFQKDIKTLNSNFSSVIDDIIKNKKETLEKEETVIGNFSYDKKLASLMLEDTIKNGESVDHFNKSVDKFAKVVDNFKRKGLIENISDSFKGLIGYAEGGSVKDGLYTTGENGMEMSYKKGNQTKVFNKADSNLKSIIDDELRNISIDAMSLTKKIVDQTTDNNETVTDIMKNTVSKLISQMSDIDMNMKNNNNEKQNNNQPIMQTVQNNYNSTNNIASSGVDSYNRLKQFIPRLG